MLGVPHDASPDDIKRAWRRAALRWHPDRNPSAEAEARFREASAAWEILSDPARVDAWRRDQAAAGWRAPDTYVDQVWDAAERATTVVFRAVLPAFLGGRRGGGAEVAATLAAALVDGRLDALAYEGTPTWLGRWRARRWRRRIAVRVYRFPAATPVTGRRLSTSRPRWLVAVHPDVLWAGGVRDPVALDDAVAFHVALQVVVILSAEVGFSWRHLALGPEEAVEAARAHDAARRRRRWGKVAVWVTVVLFAAWMLITAAPPE